MSGNTDEQMELLKQLRSLAETDDASKNRDSAMLNDAKNKWALLTKGVTTIQLIADAIKNEKVANAKEVRDNIHAVMKQFVKIAEKTQIQEDNAWRSGEHAEDCHHGTPEGGRRASRALLHTAARYG